LGQSVNFQIEAILHFYWQAEMSVLFKQLMT